jgi:hypothetical protein
VARRRIGRQAAESVRARYSSERLVAAFDIHYHEIMAADKRPVAFTDIFGSDPADWFLSCQGEPGIFSEDGAIALEPGRFSIHGLLEPTKGTAQHFQKYFPDNPRLTRWANTLRTYTRTRGSHA